MKKNRADVLVYKQGLVDSREKAKRLIMSGNIYVNEVKVLKAGEMYEEGTIFTLKGEKPRYVSRGGFKLEKAIKAFELNLDGMVCADFGASTGGFTDCMLQNGAKKVYAIDVGYGQINWSIRSNPKVITIERTNIRYLDESLIQEKLNFISIDVSFISLTLILPKAFSLIADDGIIIALIKPQFEAGREEVGKNGIVRSLETREKTIEKIYDFVLDNSFTPLDLTFSPITGAEGNQEFLIKISKDGQVFNRESIKNIVEEGNSSLRWLDAKRVKYKKLCPCRRYEYSIWTWT